MSSIDAMSILIRNYYTVFDLIIIPHHTTLHYTTPHHTALHYFKLHYGKFSTYHSHKYANITSTGCKLSSPLIQTKPLMTSMTKSAILVLKGHVKERLWKWRARDPGSPWYATRPRRERKRERERGTKTRRVRESHTWKRSVNGRKKKCNVVRHCEYVDMTNMQSVLS